VKGKTMKTFIAFAFIAVLSTGVFSQPLSGSFTIGGNNPDFTTPQAAKYSLVARGVSGPTFFNIRPGIYTEDGGNKTVLRMDSVVAGVSETNRITFQPDADAGGNVDNVILLFNRANLANADADLVNISVDFVTIRSLTLEDIDSSHTFNNHLIRLQEIPGSNPTVDGFILEDCKLIGTQHQATVGYPYGTDFGIESIQTVTDVTIRRNTFIRLLRAVSFVNSVAQTTITVEDNYFFEGYSSASGSGNKLGAGIEIACSNAILQRNSIDYVNSINGGYRGIFVQGAQTAVIERNSVYGYVEIGLQVMEFSNTPQSIFIANNMIVGGNYIIQTGAQNSPVSVRSETRNATIVHNTVVVTEGTSHPTCLMVTGENCNVLNNIIINYCTVGFITAYDLGGFNQTQNLQSNYNVIYKNPNTNGRLINHNGIAYTFLSVFQDSTGLDTNSVSKEIEFLNLLSDLHLTDCQMQDPELKGTPAAGITVDFDGDPRSQIEPTRGADEATIITNFFFGDVFTADLPGSPFSITAGKFDNLIGDGIAVPDFDNNQVLLYHNEASTRSFSLSGTLPTNFKPISVVFYDFDDDGNQDLIAGGDNPNGIKVFWGDGLGNFPETSEVPTSDIPGSVLNLVPEPFSIDEGYKTIFVPMGEEFNFLFNFFPRSLCYDYLRDNNLLTDTLPNFLHSVVVENFGGDSRFEIAGVTHTSGHFALLSNFQRLDENFPICQDSAFTADYTEQQFGTGWYSYANSIIQGDFDNDDDLDFVTCGSTSQIIYVRNDGNFNFTAESISTEDFAKALVALDYDNDGDLDFAALNLSQINGITLYINNGLANFTPTRNCYQLLLNGSPTGIVARDFDLDGLTDIAVSTLSDQFFVLYNLGGVTSVKQQQTDLIPSNFSLSQNFPNPFNPVTTIQYYLPEAGFINLKVYNLLGEEVITLADQYQTAGKHSVQFNANNLASGIYFYRLQAGSFIKTKKMILLR
jgi:hypothetical protein